MPADQPALLPVACWAGTCPPTTSAASPRVWLATTLSNRPTWRTAASVIDPRPTGWPTR